MGNIAAYWPNTGIGLSRCGDGGPHILSLQSIGCVFFLWLTPMPVDDYDYEY